MVKVTLIEYNQGKYGQKSVPAQTLVSELKSRQEYLHNLKIMDLVDFFGALSKSWDTSELIKKNFFSKNLVEFFSKKAILENLKISLRGDVQVLDDFKDLGSENILFHAQPRGLTVQWLAGNVPILGLFSIFSALLTKNMCLAKASSKGYKDLVYLLYLASKVNTKKISGKDLMRAVTIVLVDNDDRETHEFISKCADVRIAWGGDEAIKNIESLAKNPYCEDIIFGPKYSYALIDSESLDQNFNKLAQNLAVDVSVFDQYACSSPHTVFVQESKKYSALAFAQALGQKLDFVSKKLIAKGDVDPSKAYEIISIRNEYAIRGKVFGSKGTDWTVIYSKDKDLFNGCFSRVIAVKPIKKLEEISKFNSRKMQTLGLGMALSNKLQLIDKITINGIDRCPNLGYMTFLQSPWDGMFVFDRLVRWVTINKD